MNICVIDTNNISYTDILLLKGFFDCSIQSKSAIKKNIMEKLKYKDIEVDLDQILCKVKDKPIHLTKNEFLLLKYLLEASQVPKVVTRKDIIKDAWKNDIPLRFVDATVSRLRKKLGTAGNYIKTRNGFGYGMVEY